MRILYTIGLIFGITYISGAQQVTPSITDVNPKITILKFDFFSPLTGNLTVGAERNLKSEIFNLSWDTRLGIVGLGGSTHYTNRIGGFIKTGPRIYFEDAPMMEGFFFSPQMVFGAHKFTDPIDDNNHPKWHNNSFETSVTYIASHLNLGYQHIIKKRLSVDFHGGIGYGFISQKRDGNPMNFPAWGGDEITDWTDPYVYSGYIFDRTPFSFSGNFSFGWLISK